MPKMSRRRFLTLSAAAAFPLPARARAVEITQWHGTALGAEAAIYLQHLDADVIISRAVAEIDRLESVFSLYRTDSALSQLNLTSRLQAPPFELLECLAQCGRVHTATQGLFDPTIQPLWQLYATSFDAGHAPAQEQIAATLPLIDFSRITYDSDTVILPAGMALTLNGVAQGFIADKIADLLAAEGLTDILINTGEFRALGQLPGAAGWPVKLTTGGEVNLVSRALATSSPLGTFFDRDGTVGHILSPLDGMPAIATWSSVSISAASAALADALSTAACLMPDRVAIQASLANFQDARIEALV
jgi:FAD:protein FMN transferase